MNFVLKIILFSFFLLVYTFVDAQQVPDTLVNNVPDSLQNKLEPEDFLRQGAKYINTYGSYRINFGMNTDGQFGMSDNSSRFGLQGRMPINKSETIEAFAAVELGTNLVDKDEIIVFSSDPGAQASEEGNAVYSRLGFVGISTPYFDLSIGKQWSVYYDVSGYTDQFWAFGGDASGTYNLGTDGGVSGTGRASRLLLVRLKNTGPIKVAAQAQFRALTDNDKKFGDSYGMSLRYEPKNGFMAGVAANIVADGVDNPIFDQPKKGDQAYVAGVGYVKNNINATFTLSRFFDHEKIAINDSTDYYYSGHGIELYLSYNFPNYSRWKVATGFNYLKPDASAEVGDFEELYFLAELSYTFAKASNVFSVVKVNNNVDRMGDIDNVSIIGVGMRFSFGY